MRKKLIAIATVIALGVTCLPSTIFAKTNQNLSSDVSNITFTEEAYTIDSDGIIKEIDFTKLSDSEKERSVIPKTIKGITVTGIAGYDLGYVIQSVYPNGSPKEVVLPDGIQTIGKFAFSYCQSLESIYLPDSIVSIESEAFSDCTVLKSVRMPSFLKYMGVWTFQACKSLENIIIPNSVINIDRQAFMGCESLTSIKIPDAVTVLGEAAFSDCKQLKSVQFSSRSQIRSLEDTFKDCELLENVELPSQLTNIGSGVFIGCKSLKQIELPSQLESIGTYAFSNSNLETIYVPDSVKTIGLGAFSKCTNLIDVRLPSQLKCMEENLFPFCSKLTSVNIPDGVTDVKRMCFANCSNLINVYLPQEVTSIIEVTFANCSNLERIIISDKMTNIENRAFMNCTKLDKVLMMSEKDEYDSHMNDLIATMESQTGTIITKYLGHNRLKAKQTHLTNYGSKVYDLDDLFERPIVYECTNSGKVESNEFSLPVRYTLSKKSKDSQTYIDEINKKLYIGENEDGIITLTAQFQNKTESVTIQTAPIRVEKLEIKHQPSQLIYNEDELFNPQGLIIEATYNNGPIKDIAWQDEKTNFSFSPSLTEPLKPENKQILVTYGGKDATVDVQVIPKIVENIVVKRNPSQLKYTEGDVFHPEGLVLRTTYNDGSSKDIAYHDNKDDFSFRPSLTQILTSDMKQVEVTYAGKTVTINIQVTPQVVIPDSKEEPVNPPSNNKTQLPDINSTENINYQDKNVSFDVMTTHNGITYDANGNRVKIDKYGNIIQTHDETLLVFFIGAFMISGGVISYIFLKKRKTQE